MPASELAGGSAHPLPGVCASPWRPFPLPCARCSVVYISSPRRGAHAPRDRILSLVALAPGALHKELGEGEAQEMGTELKQGLKLGWVRVLLAPQPSSGSSCCSQAKVWSPLPCVWAPWPPACVSDLTTGLRTFTSCRVSTMPILRGIIGLSPSRL